MSASVDNSAAVELGELARALRAHLEWQQDTGAYGLPAASVELRAARGAPEFPARAVSLRAATSSVARSHAPAPTHPNSAEPAVVSAVERRPEGHGRAALPAEVSGTPAVSIARPASPMGAASAAAEASAASRASSASRASTTSEASSAPIAPAAHARPVVQILSAALPADSVRRLEVLAREVTSCTRCGLHAERTQTVFARGTGVSGLCFVGEGPGAEEDLQGFPFVGAAGQLLDKMIGAIGLGRDDVYVCNIVKCRPPKNRKPELEEMRACTPYLTEQLELIQPRVIVALGATAVQGLLGTTEGITRMRGSWRLYRGRIAVMPTFHPAYLLRQPSAKRFVWEDLQEVAKHLGRSLPGR